MMKQIKQRARSVRPTMRAAVMALLVGASAARGAPPESAPASLNDRTEGIWPTPQMLEDLIRRQAGDAAATYDLSAERRAKLEEMLVGRWSSFLEHHRPEIQPLLNEYLEARAALQPPSPDQVADWAARAMPVWESFHEHIQEGEGEIRSLLTERQREMFDAARPARKITLDRFRQRLERWRAGQFQPQEWWSPPAGRQPGRPGQAARPPRPADTAALAPDQADAGVPDRIEAELTAWETYVADFCDRFELDLSQRNAAESMLRELTDRAVDYCRRHRDQIGELEQRIIQPAGLTAEQVHSRIETLYGPIDRMFHELDDRLNKLPTSAQRRRAGKES